MSPRSPDRRQFLSTGAAATALVAGSSYSDPAESAASRAGTTALAATSDVRALTFDVFGTVVDWRSSIIREGELLAEAKGLTVDWPQFADAWRAGYEPATDKVQKGELRGSPSTS